MCLKVRITFISALTFVLLIAGCTSTDTAKNSLKYMHYELYFGMNSTKGQITEEQWKDFLDNVITPNFEDGLTVIDAYGQWMDKSGKIIKEKSKILTIFDKDTNKTNKKISDIRAKYKKLYNQESVMLKTNPVKVSF